MQGGYAKKYRVKPRFFIILALLGLLVWGIVSIVNYFRPVTVEWGRLSNDQSLTAIVLRDEQLIPAAEFSKLSCIAAEGGQVKKGDAVAQLYLSGFSDKDIATLAKIENEIKDYQENNILKEVKDDGLNTLNTKINDTMNEISAMALSGQTQGLAAAEQDLRNFMRQRKDYMPTIIKSDESLDRMYQNEQTLQQKIEQTRKVVNSTADGFVSYYLDGFEKILNTSAIAKMTPGTMKALLDSILNSKTSFTSTESVKAGQPICRIVNASKWYAVVVMSAGENPFVQGSTFDVTFDGLQDTVSARAVKVLTEGRTALAVLEITKGVKEMISVRLVNGHLGRDIEGFRVPLNMISQSGGKSYITTAGVDGGKAKKIEITLLGKDEKYAIIQEAADTGELDPGLPLVRP